MIYYNTPNSIAQDLRECDNAQGYTPVVISYNHQFFTTGFVFPNPDTGVVMLRVNTPNNAYIMEY